MSTEKTILSCNFGNKQISIETGHLAKQADGSVVVRYGDTMVLVTAVSSKKQKEGQDFFPLTVDYVEKYYAAGKFPGGYIKRETRPNAAATLNARLIDRPLRPLFPEGYFFDTHIVATILSVDDEHDPEIAASLGASAALMVSDIPFLGPTAAVHVGRIKGELVANPTLKQQEESELLIMVAGTEKAIMMVEGEATEVPEEEVLAAILFGHRSIQEVIRLQHQLRDQVGKPKREYQPVLKDEQLKKKIADIALQKVKKAFAVREKLERYQALSAIHDELKAALVTDAVEDKKAYEKNIANLYEDLKYSVMREQVLSDARRVDGRGMKDIRNISSEVGLVPRAHGSSLFTRGETQVLAVVTLGTKDDEQMMDDLRSGVSSQRFMLHYNFPPFSVGEAGALRAPGRREIGHGALAERALSHMIPDAKGFPYTVRIVCETLESNGSSSMASVCSGSMALMDAGVPVPKPVAGIAMGLIKEGSRVAVLSDILGDEDHLGDMDFKVAGTSEGVTAIQMDIKIEGVDEQIMRKALAQAYEGRQHILKEMQKSISQARSDISKFAPRIISMQVKPDKVREVIGTGGKVIRGIIENTGVKIDINDDGLINIASVDGESAQRAMQMIESIVEEVEIGKVYTGKVKKIVDFGAFVEVRPGTDGLLHVSEIANERVNNVNDYLREGDVIDVKVLDIDRQGKVRLSRKALL